MTTRARAQLSAHLPELEQPFQKQITDLLTALGYDWLHSYPLRDRHNRWRTSLSGSLAKGWPDLLVMRALYVGVIEVKTDKGRFRPEQLPMLERLSHSSFDFVWVLRPEDDLQLVAQWLASPAAAPRIYGWET